MPSQEGSRTRLVVTPGDPDGIGPEIVWKALRRNHSRWKRHAVLCVGARKPFDRLNARVIEADPENLIPPQETRPHVWLLEAPTRTDPAQLLEGYQVGWSIETAVMLVREGSFDALVTGPIHKERMNRGGYRHAGHTDFLAELCKEDGLTPKVTMMLANETLRVSLVTTHVSVNEVPARLSRSGIVAATDHTIAALRNWWGIRRPKIAICALNPHAGEAGLFGREEIDVIAPAVAELRKKWGKVATLSDPLPADTLFAKHIAAKPRDRADAVVCMYHDQGLIPVKLIDFPRTVNITLGLPIVRTSVDHGTGFDIAWKNRADPRSFESALDLALRLTKKKRGRK
jgi:4-hydroxythreonine-4-phosphate dehydrogenase